MPRFFLLFLGLVAQFLIIPQSPLIAGEAIVVASPIVIAHRGASGYRPEHTRSAYVVAIDQGADYVEPDLVVTKDGVLIVRHDGYLSTSTDVATHPEFADRKRVFKGKDDWFVFDFTLAEIKTLRAIQPRPERGTSFDGIEDILTFDELVEIAGDFNASGRRIGLFVEMKHPEFFISQDPNLAEKLAAKLDAAQARGIPVVLQSFDGGFILEMADKTSVPLTLTVGGELDKKTGWYKPDVAFELFYGKVQGFNLNKALLVNKDGSPSGLLERLHNNGAKAYIWTIRDDQVPAQFSSVQQELKMFLGLGVDGVFTDFPDTAINVRNSLRLLEKGPH